MIREVVIGASCGLDGFDQRGLRCCILLVIEHIKGVAGAVGEVQVGLPLAVLEVVLDGGEAHNGAGAVVHAVIGHIGVDGLVPSDAIFDVILDVEAFAGLLSLGSVAHDATELEVGMDTSRGVAVLDDDFTVGRVVGSVARDATDHAVAGDIAGRPAVGDDGALRSLGIVIAIDAAGVVLGGCDGHIGRAGIDGRTDDDAEQSAGTVRDRVGELAAHIHVVNFDRVVFGAAIGAQDADRTGRIGDIGIRDREVIHLADHGAEQAGGAGEVGDGMAVAVEIELLVGCECIDRLPVRDTVHVDVVLQDEIHEAALDHLGTHRLEVIDRGNGIGVALGTGSEGIERALAEEHIGRQRIGDSPVIRTGGAFDGHGKDVVHAVFQAGSGHLDLGGRGGLAVAGHHHFVGHEFVGRAGAHLISRSVRAVVLLHQVGIGLEGEVHHGVGDVASLGAGTQTVGLAGVGSQFHERFLTGNIGIEDTFHGAGNRFLFSVAGNRENGKGQEKVEYLFHDSLHLRRLIRHSSRDSA